MFVTDDYLTSLLYQHNSLLSSPDDESRRVRIQIWNQLYRQSNFLRHFHPNQCLKRYTLDSIQFDIDKSKFSLPRSTLRTLKLIHKYFIKLCSIQGSHSLTYRSI